MNNTDWITIIGNISQSLFSVQRLVSGFAYLIGTVFLITAVMKLKKIGDARTNSSSQEKIFVPIAYFVGGAGLIFLPTMVKVLTNTAFGSGNVLEYTSYSPYSIYNSMRVLIQTAGLIWFVRGCVLLVTGSQPGGQHGPKGLTFIVAGILAINFEGTVGVVDYMVNKFIIITNTGGSASK